MSRERGGGELGDRGEGVMSEFGERERREGSGRGSEWKERGVGGDRNESELGEK